MKGKIVGIIGEVGLGKSLILQAIIGEMLYNQQNPFKIIIAGSYVGQTEILDIKFICKRKYFIWINISKIEILQCIEDLEILIKGDETIIGDKGINLPGGQKARISLARAISSDADIFLLDDPISAVDAHVGNFIMNKCLNGYLKGKTGFLSPVPQTIYNNLDYVYLLENGGIIEQGTFYDIQQSKTYFQVHQILQIQAEYH